MNRRTFEINKAIANIKKFHKNCLLCGKNEVVGAHLIPRNNPAPKNDPTKESSIVPLCWNCHRIYDLNKTMDDRIEFWESKGHPELANRIRKIIET